MNIRKVNMSGIELTESERACLGVAYEIIKEILNTHEDECAHLVSPITGEVVHISELPRVLGVLGAFATQNAWEHVEE